MRASSSSETWSRCSRSWVPFSGTITENLVSDHDGKVVSKGQAIFKIEPDEKMDEESEDAIAARRKEVTIALMERTD